MHFPIISFFLINETVPTECTGQVKPVSCSVFLWPSDPKLGSIGKFG